MTTEQDFSLYVGDLHKDVNERMLYEVFKTYGEVAGVNVCRDSYSKESLGYAYVNFKEKDSAEKAMSALNYTEIQGLPCRIMWVVKDPEARRAGKGNIFIRNLHPSITNRDLYETFSQLGKLLSCKVATTKEGKSKGYGYVHFEEEEVANLAIKEVDGKVIEDMEVSVSKFIPKRERDAYKASSWTNIFVKDLPEEIKTDEQLQEIFSEYGTILSPKLMFDKQTGKAFGFVNFEDHESAAKAVEGMNGAEVNGKTLFVSRAQKKSERVALLKKQHEQRKRELQKKYQGKNLYVKNLEDNITEDDLIAAFSEFGNITSCAIMKDEKAYSKGFGFVCFETEESAKAAIENMRNRTLPGGKKLLFVALHEPREQRNRRMQQNKKRRKQQQMGFPAMYAQPRPAYYPPYGAVPMAQPGRMPAAMPTHQAMPAQPAYNIPSLATLKSLGQEERKTTLGEAFYQRISQIKPQDAQKITGMLLNADWTLEKKYALLTDETVLRQAIERASAVLHQNMGN